MSRHPIANLFDLLGRRWALRVLWELRDEPLPYRRLRERCDEVSSSVLATRLRELAAAGVIEQTPDGYALTAAGRELLGHLLPLNEWAKRYASGTGTRWDTSSPPARRCTANADGPA